MDPYVDRKNEIPFWLHAYAIAIRSMPAIVAVKTTQFPAGWVPCLAFITVSNAVLGKNELLFFIIHDESTPNHFFVSIAVMTLPNHASPPTQPLSFIPAPWTWRKTSAVCEGIRLLSGI